MDLVGYGSSDEEAEDVRSEVRQSHEVEASSRPPRHEEVSVGESNGRPTRENERNGEEEANRVLLPSVVAPADGHDGPTIGPVIGPAMPQTVASSPGSEGTPQPQSPYTATRSLVRDLTLPPIPNLDIPPSPPGSPRASTSAKFAHFLELKKQGVHFNGKLARSSALKNPSLLQNLMTFAGIEEQGQYASTLPKEVWDPTAFPAWAYKEELAKSQQEVLKKREEARARGQREALEFVPATVSGNSSRGGTPGASNTAARGLGKSAAERVMAGLDREKTRSPAIAADTGKRREIEMRSGNNDGFRSRRDRSTSASRDRRKRSRSP